MFERFGRDAHRILANAEAVAAGVGSHRVEVSHLRLALRRRLDLPSSSRRLPFDDEVLRLLERAHRRSLQTGASEVTVEDLAALLGEDAGPQVADRREDEDRSEAAKDDDGPGAPENGPVRRSTPTSRSGPEPERQRATTTAANAAPKRPAAAAPPARARRVPSGTWAVVLTAAVITGAMTLFAVTGSDGEERLERLGSSGVPTTARTAAAPVPVTVPPVPETIPTAPAAEARRDEPAAGEPRYGRRSGPSFGSAPGR